MNATDNAEKHDLESIMITLENAEIKLIIRPDLGGRIDRFQDLKTGKDWLWHPSEYDDSDVRSLRDTRKGSLSLGASFDENWTGGWDEIFPNDAAGEFHEYSFEGRLKRIASTYTRSRILCQLKSQDLS
ncbi:hypothetical protein [Phormidesmis priestleyi]